MSLLIKFLSIKAIWEQNGFAQNAFWTTTVPTLEGQETNVNIVHAFIHVQGMVATARLVWTQLSSSKHQPCFYWSSVQWYLIESNGAKFPSSQRVFCCWGFQRSWLAFAFIIHLLDNPHLNSFTLQRNSVLLCTVNFFSPISTCSSMLSKRSNEWPY